MMTEYAIIQDMYADLADDEHQRRVKMTRQQNMSKAQAAKQQKAQERGYNVAVKAPFGYHVLSGKLLPNPREQEALCLMRTLRLRGLSYYNIAKTLTEQGFISRAGTPYFGQTIYKFLNPKPDKRKVA